MYVGIDISAKTVDLAYRANGKDSKVERFEQTIIGHAKIIKRLKTLHPTVVVMEATGIYYLDLAVALHEAGLPVCVINPKSYHHFAALKLKQTKTDLEDAALLAEYGE